MGAGGICSQLHILENWGKGLHRVRAAEGATRVMICASRTQTQRQWSALENLGAICIYLFVILTCEITPFHSASLLLLHNKN